MNEIKVIVFDLGNVFLKFDYNIILTRLNKIEAGLGDKFFKLYADNYDIHSKFEKWEITTEEFTNIVMGWLENKISLDQFHDIYSNIFTPDDDVINLLPKLKENYRLFLLSNTNYIHQKYGWEKYNFYHHFEKLILSHEVGAAKPDRKIYEAVQNITGEKPEAHLFIDDIEENVDGARSLGWDGIQFTGYDNLISEFEKRNITL